MDRLGGLRSHWTAPLIAGLLALALWVAASGNLQSTSERFGFRPCGASDLDRMASCEGAPTSPQPDADVRKSFPWLPALATQSRAILTSYNLAGQETSTGGDEKIEGPLLAPSQPVSPPAEKSAESTGPTVSPRLNVFVPEPELLPDGTAETGEPIPPRLSARLGQPVPAPDAAARPSPAVQGAPEPSGPPAASSAAPKAGAGAGVAVQAPGRLLMPAVDGGQRSGSLELIAQEADARTRRGFELSGRGAYLSARAEFIAALRLVSQGLDTERQTSMHSQALAMGLTALKEATDFAPEGSKLEADLDLAGMIGRHRTPVLKGADLSTLTPMTALQCYLTFAQEQLGVAAGREVAGSMALRGLGKLYETMADRKMQDALSARPKAMVFYQASLLACSQNFLASNDLGVLLARNGRYEDARVALEHSLSILPQPTGWHNLELVYQQLGNAAGAREAKARGEALQKAGSSTQPRRAPNQLVQWIDPQAFAQTNQEQPGTPAPNLPASPSTRPAISRSADTDRQHAAWSSLFTRPDARK